MILGNIYKFSIVTKQEGKLDIRRDFQLLAKNSDMAVAAMVTYKNKHHEGSAMIFKSEDLKTSRVLKILRSRPIGDELTEYYMYLKKNEGEILATLKSIRDDR